MLAIVGLVVVWHISLVQVNITHGFGLAYLVPVSVSFGGSDEELAYLGSGVGACSDRFRYFTILCIKRCTISYFR